MTASKTKQKKQQCYVAFPIFRVKGLLSPIVFIVLIISL